MKPGSFALSGPRGHDPGLYSRPRKLYPVLVPVSDAATVGKPRCDSLVALCK